MNGQLSYRWLLFAIALLLLPPLSAFGEEFKIKNLSAKLVEGKFLMDAEIDYRFSDKAIEALVNGVPLTLEVQVQLRDSNAWIWQEDLLDARLRYRIRYLALPAIYQVVDLQSDTQQNFHTQRSAFEALGDISNFSLISIDKLEQGRKYRLSLRSSLDIEALPLPLRPMAYVTSAWQLSSDWSELVLRR
ncbi:MAG: DUF4390 domain-containing protein [Chromatiaceae bacterium]|nr:DUF4390 domain-containing protein [Gammaproteobacteria bacterium]MCP5428143.1 DUF4390 domain-containing protein [Chromatiaceae bacterium]MCB1861697.1 DUF4390 domain-containing protein [Gammaproteobacteria bacterium]MCB1872656.1 DUF4390 domain-containing protein [Gammaproteobacteria bacterium]MCB1881948.1 DUF4390 domain-containing protein [Gammaproteobacteria bacterium]